MAAYGLYTHIASNKFRSMLLLAGLLLLIYVLVFAGFLLLGGRAGDLFGRRRLFIIGIALFSIASLVGGFSQTST